MTSTNSSAKTAQTLQLADGRSLGYAEYGSDDGKPLIYCHGLPGSRLEVAFLDQYARHAGVRLISIDRPGMGLSTFQPGRSFLDWPAEVMALADHLQIGRFAVLGMSGGSPYAQACAYTIPDRLISCGIVSGIEPLALGTAGMNRGNRLIFFCARRLPWLLTPLIGLGARSFQTSERARRAMTKGLPQLVKPDREALLAFDGGESLALSTAEAYRQGVRGAAYEGRLYGREWGFRLQDIRMQPLYLWHGELDTNVGVAMARAAAHLLPGCVATYYPNDGHLSTPLNHQEEILTALFRT